MIKSQSIQAAENMINAVDLTPFIGLFAVSASGFSRECAPGTGGIFWASASKGTAVLSKSSAPILKDSGNSSRVFS
jgi:hypothetical protein